MCQSLLTSVCWVRSHRSIPECALSTWLTGVDCEFGPDCEDSSHFRRPNIDCIETVQLPDESGFGFLPADSEVALDFLVKPDCASFSG